MDDQQPEVAAQRLLQAISTLHRQGTPSTELAAANTWLEKFEQSTVAWQVNTTIALLLAVLCTRCQA